MKKGTIRKISYSFMREVLAENAGTPKDRFYLSQNVSISLGVNLSFSRLLSKRTPYAFEDVRMGFLLQGELTVTVNLVTQRLKAGNAIFLGQGSVVQLEELSDDALLMGLIVDYNSFTNALNQVQPGSFTGEVVHFTATTTKEESEFIKSNLQTLWNMVHVPNHSKSVVAALVAAHIHYYLWMHSRAMQEKAATPSREREIFEQFLRLVNKHYATEHRLAFYASQLCLTERYLSTAVRIGSGSCAKEWIDRALITRAQVMLRHTNLQISQIAERLHFANDSFFCKYFKRLTGETPVQYRGRG